MTEQAASRSLPASPAVSVVMPLLNGRPFLAEAIGSVLSQSLRNFEVIIVDNGSTDGSKEYAESFEDCRVRVLREPRQGAAHAINTGIEASRADLIAIMDADDISLPDRLALQ